MSNREMPFGQQAWIIIGLIVLVPYFQGCSTMTPDDREYYNLTTRVLWQQCRAIREGEGRTEWIRASGGRLKPSHMQMRYELALNHCSRRVI